MVDSIVLKVTLPTAREGWYTFAKAAAAPNFGTVVWPTAVVDAFEAGASVEAALATGYAATDSDTGPVYCTLPLVKGQPIPNDYASTPRADGSPGTAWDFGAGRSRAEISSDGRTVTVRGPLESAVDVRATAHPTLMTQYRARAAEAAAQHRALAAASEAAELLAQARRSRPLAGRDCRKLVSL